MLQIEKLNVFETNYIKPKIVFALYSNKKLDLKTIDESRNPKR